MAPRHSKGGSLSFPCPRCSDGGTVVKDSRPDIDGIRRRRECVQCNFRFNTIEADEMAPQTKTSQEKAVLMARLESRLLAIGDLIDELRAEHD